MSSEKQEQTSSSSSYCWAAGKHLCSSFQFQLFLQMTAASIYCVSADQMLTDNINIWKSNSFQYNASSNSNSHFWFCRWAGLELNRKLQVLQLNATNSGFLSLPGSYMTLPLMKNSFSHIIWYDLSLKKIGICARSICRSLNFDLGCTKYKIYPKESWISGP